MKNVKFDKTLFYYDGILLFTGKTKDDTYLFSIVNQKEGTYIGIKISETDLTAVENGTKDISRIFTSPKSKLFYPCTIEKHGSVKLSFLSTKDLIKEFLCPNKGFFLTPEQNIESKEYVKV